MQYRNEQVRTKFNLPASVSVYNVSIEGNVVIGEHTYLNEGSRISTGNVSKVSIGRHCAIGRNVNITSKTHSLRQPTTDENHSEILHVESDVVIGSYVWIGDKVTVMPGVTIGDYAVIGANAFVNRDVRSFEVVGGVPARHIKFNTSHYRFNPEKWKESEQK
jgi:acetyltransferase-like isoleucine patch superfamily enzyme